MRKFMSLLMAAVMVLSVMTVNVFAAKDGSIMVYVTGTVLTIAGNGSGKIYMNEDSNSCCMKVSAEKAKPLALFRLA